MLVSYGRLDKDIVKELANQYIEKNFDELYDFFPQKVEFMHELTPLYFQINYCLMFELHIASITLTNHFLERLLKIALVYNEVGTRKGFTNVSYHFKDAHTKYQDKKLFDSINSCFDKGLISEEQKDYLHKEVREQIRNGFSHSDPDTIIDPKKGKKLFTRIEPVDENHILHGFNLDPFIQSQFMYNFAKNEALRYFKNIFGISKQIEHILVQKGKLS